MLLIVAKGQRAILLILAKARRFVLLIVAFSAQGVISLLIGGRLATVDLVGHMTPKSGGVATASSITRHQVEGWSMERRKDAASSRMSGRGGEKIVEKQTARTCYRFSDRSVGKAAASGLTHLLPNQGHCCC